MTAAVPNAARWPTCDPVRRLEGPRRAGMRVAGMIRATVSRMLVAGTPLDQIRYDPFTMD